MSTPTFALMLTRLDGWYQSQIWEGANAAADRWGVRIVGVVGSALGDLHGDGGSSEIYRIASSEGFDGYLPLVGSLANANGIGMVEKLLASLPRRPTVCVGIKCGEYPAVVPSQGGVDQVVEHLVWSHGLKRIAFISGPLVNPDAQARLDLFRRTMAACGLDFSLDWMDQGGFTKDKGEAAAERLLKRIGIPEAIVCANDAMAFGAQMVLDRMGLRVPTDVVLTGYDDIEEARIQVPPLTTVSAHPFEIAYRSVERLTEILQAGRGGGVETVPSELVVRSSCGCVASPSGLMHADISAPGDRVPTVETLREDLTGHGAAHYWPTLQTADLRELDRWDRTLHRILEGMPESGAPEAGGRLAKECLVVGSLVSRARALLSDRRHLQLHQVLRDQYSLTQRLLANLGAEGFAERLQVGLDVWRSKRMRLLLFREDLSPVAKPVFQMENFQLVIDARTGVRRPLPGDRLLPPDEGDQDGWAMLSLSMREEHYGLVQLQGWTANQLFMESIRLTLVTVLSSALRFRGERGLHEQLRRLSQRDDLTGLFNRRGLLDHGKALVHEALKERRRIGVVLCDLDGLKGINDTYGHFDGDLAIRAMAASLEDVFRPGDVVSRLGGDEFAVLASLAPEGDLDGAMDRLRQALSHRSGQLNRPWTVGTSAGWMSWDPRDGTSLEDVLARADQSLYRDKRERKSHPPQDETGGG